MLQRTKNQFGSFASSWAHRKPSVSLCLEIISQQETYSFPLGNLQVSLLQVSALQKAKGLCKLSNIPLLSFCCDFFFCFIYWLITPTSPAPPSPSRTLRRRHPSNLGMGHGENSVHFTSLWKTTKTLVITGLIHFNTLKNGSKIPSIFACKGFLGPFHKVCGSPWYYWV